MRFRGPGRRSLGAKSQKVSKKSRKSLLAQGPKSPKKVSKKVQKVSKNPFSDLFLTFLSGLFRDFFRTFGARPREIFFETFLRRTPRLLLPGPRNLDSNSRFMRLFQAPLDASLGSPFFHVYLNSVQQMVSGELAGDGLQTGFSRHGLPPQRAPLDTVYPLREHLNSVQRMVSGGCCEGLFPDTVCWTRLRNTWFFASLSVHGLYFTVYAASIFCLPGKH